MRKKEMTRENIPKAEMDMIFNIIHWFPNRKKHESGWQRRTIVGENQEGMFFIGDFCDDLMLIHEKESVKYWSDIRIDTTMDGVNRLWSNRFKFKLRINCSTTDFIILNK